MGEYANVKRNKIKKCLLRWLVKKQGIEIKHGGKHQILIKYVFWERPFPLPFLHNEVNKHLIKELMQKLVDSEVCTKEEFDQNI
ncbi:MAG: hypothetical protein WC460_00165 [Patescibacteria group bacterium]